MSMEDLQKRASSAVKANKEVVYGLTGIYFCCGFVSELDKKTIFCVFDIVI